MQLDQLGLATMIRGARQAVDWRRHGRYWLVLNAPSIVGQPRPTIFAWRFWA
jgi:hypothetical protein